MEWPERRVKSWDEFIDEIHSVMDRFRPKDFGYIFRGQSCAAWTLKPSLIRNLDGWDADAALELEHRLFGHFQIAARQQLHPNMLNPHTPQHLFVWWGLMQHHRAPTRLLDWTKSPYVAAYFAVVSLSDVDSAVWGFDGFAYTDRFPSKRYKEEYQTEEEYYKLFNDPNSPKTLAISKPTRQTSRQVAQECMFTYSYQIMADHADVIASGLRKGTFFKIVIPKDLKLRFLWHLRSMNITGASLFPDLDGIGRYASETVKLEFLNPVSDKQSSL